MNDESQQDGPVCVCGHHWDWHDDGKFNCLGPTPCQCLAFRPSQPGAPTPTQVIGDEMADKRATEAKRTSDKAKASQPRTSLKRRILRFAKEMQLWVSKFFKDGKNTGMYPGQPDVTVGDWMGIEVKHRKLTAFIKDAFSQVHGANKGTGRMDAVVIVDKDQHRGPGVRRDAWFIIRLDDVDTYNERVQENE